MQPGPSDGTATVKFVDVGQADMGFPSPGIFSFALENGMKLKSAFHWGALDTFSLAFRKGEGTQRSEDARRQDHPARLGRLAVDRRSDAGRAGRRHHQGEVCRSRLADLGHGAGRPARAMPRSPGKACAPSGSAAGSTSNTGSACSSRRCLPTPIVVRAADLEDPDKKAFLDKYLRGWAMGLEVRLPQPARRGAGRVRAVPVARQANIGPELGTMSILQQIATSFAATCRKRKGWGEHDMAAWQTFFDKIYELRQITKPVKAEDVCTNACIAAANDFDHDKVKADAAGLQAAGRSRGDRYRGRQGAPLRPGRSA